MYFSTWFNQLLCFSHDWIAPVPPVLFSQILKTESLINAVLGSVMLTFLLGAKGETPYIQRQKVIVCDFKSLIKIQQLLLLVHLQ